jgi:uncharacterized protein
MLSAHLRVLYLHGFASGPGSRKARFFQEKLVPQGVSFDAPALDEGDFRHLTITGQLHVVDRAAEGHPVVLIGSSLGGYLAALYAARHANVERLVLLAPAFRFHQLWVERTDPLLYQQWRKEGVAPVYHYGLDRDVEVGFELMEDSARYEPSPNFSQPALIFHGTQDQSVPVEYSAEFAKEHSNVSLIKLHSGHELTDVLQEIWDATGPFILNRSTEL